MLPTLAGRGEYIIVDKWSHRSHLGRRLQKGDIVTVLRPDVLGRRQTKRITAMEGDTVTYTIPFTDQQEKTVMVCPLSTASQPRTRLMHTQKVPRGHVWVEGDNPLQSHDSKHYGAISMNLVEGRVLCQIWPTVCSLIA